MNGFRIGPVAGAGLLRLKAPQCGDDHVPCLKMKIEIEIEEPTTVSTDDLLDGVAYAIKDLVRGFGIYLDDSEVCETASNVYFKTLDAKWERIDFCLGQVDHRHLHVSADVGYTLNRRAIKAEVKLEEVGGQ